MNIKKIGTLLLIILGTTFSSAHTNSYGEVSSVGLGSCASWSPFTMMQGHGFFAHGFNSLFILIIYLLIIFILLAFLRNILNKSNTRKKK